MLRAVSGTCMGAVIVVTIIVAMITIIIFIFTPMVITLSAIVGAHLVLWRKVCW